MTFRQQYYFMVPGITPILLHIYIVNIIRRIINEFEEAIQYKTITQYLRQNKMQGCIMRLMKIDILLKNSGIYEVEIQNAYIEKKRFNRREI